MPEMYFDETGSIRSDTQLSLQTGTRVSLFESFSGHVNHNNYSAYMTTNARNSLRQSTVPGTPGSVSEVRGNDLPLFDRSVSLIEFCIQSQIFTRSHEPQPVPDHLKKKMSKKELKKLKESQRDRQRDMTDHYGDPLVTFNLSIGDVYMRTWTGDEANWDAMSNDPSEFNYHAD